MRTEVTLESKAIPSTHDIRLATLHKISAFAERELPAKLKTPNLTSPYLFGCGLSLLTAALSYNSINLPLFGAFLLTALILFSFGYIRLWDNHKTTALATSEINEGIKELEGIKDFIVEYTQFVDRRTSSYFHCVTNTKVASYFALTEIRDSLMRRIHKLHELVKSEKRADLVEAFVSLQGTLVINSKVMSHSGTLRIIPVARLNLVVRQLVEGIEEGLDFLESELEVGTENEAAN